MLSETQLFSVQLPRGMRVPTPDGAFRIQSPTGEHLVMDHTAKLVEGCTVAVFVGWLRRNKPSPRAPRK